MYTECFDHNDRITKCLSLFMESTCTKLLLPAKPCVPKNCFAPPKTVLHPQGISQGKRV